MAREGLRTLVVAKKTLTLEQYTDFEVSLSFGPILNFKRVLFFWRGFSFVLAYRSKIFY